MAPVSPASVATRMIATPRHPDGTANTARILGAGTPRPPLPPATRPLTKEDEYNFDVGGYLLLPKILSDAELAAANAAFDAGAFAPTPPSGWDPVTGVHIDEAGPLAALTSHPVLTGTLIQLFWSEETGDMRHGAQYKLEAAPTVLPPLNPAAPSAPPMWAPHAAPAGGAVFGAVAPPTPAQLADSLLASLGAGAHWQRGT